MLHSKKANSFYKNRDIVMKIGFLGLKGAVLPSKKKNHNDRIFFPRQAQDFLDNPRRVCMAPQFNVLSGRLESYRMTFKLFF